MILHEDKSNMSDAIRATASHFKIREIYVEKDYWVTYALNNISRSALRDIVVFKGGTSLSKAYKLIERFSEDVDLALLKHGALSNNQVKNKLKDITKTACGELVEDNEYSGKKSTIRKVLYQYPQLKKEDNWGGVSRKLLIEANAFSDPVPYNKMMINSYIGEYLEVNGQNTIADKYKLMPFELNVLGLERTITEKIMSLVKASYDDNPVVRLREKVRHIYDIHKLMAREDVGRFIFGDEFFSLVSCVCSDDAKSPVGDALWTKQPLASCYLFSDVHAAWDSIEQEYERTFRDMVWGDLPEGEKILETLKMLGERLEAFDAACPMANDYEFKPVG